MTHSCSGTAPEPERRQAIRGPCQPLLIPSVRLLDPPHTRLRFALGALALEAGRTDGSDAGEVAALKARARRTLVLLEWFAVCVPARTVAENAAVLVSMRSAGPPEAFDAILATVGELSAPAE